LAIPLALLLQLAFERLVRSDTEAAPPAGRDRADVLRYDARTLAIDAHRLAEAPALATSELVGLTEEIEALASELDTLLPAALGEKRRPAAEAA
jgi:hypothetical protein